MHFFIIGLSHKTASLEVRERLAIPAQSVPSFLSKLLQEEDIQEGMVLSTCNRVEICLVARHAEKAERSVRGLFAERGGASRDWENHLNIREGEAAVRHLFRVTAGLDSMVLGEPQIGGQVKEAYSQAVASGSCGSYLNKLIHKAFSVSKRVRTETGIGRHPVSVSYAAVLLAEKIFGDLVDTKVLLLGTGEMGVLAARHLVERRAGEIWIANRTGEKAEEAAREISARALPFSEIPGKIEEADIVISSTAASDFVIRESQVREAMKKRKNKPVFFIDIAVPRNIDPGVNEVENAYLYDIDHLQGIVDGNLKEREKESRKAESLIEQEVRAFQGYLAERDLSPTIRDLSQKFDLIRRKEVKKFLAKQNGIPASLKEGVHACTEAIVNKILHDPILLMKTEETKEGGPKYSEILKKLFRLEGEG